MEMQNNNQNISVADSSIIVSLISPDDAYHDHAKELTRQADEEGTTIITPEVVFVETINILGKKVSHEVAMQAAELIITSGMFVIVESTDCLSAALEKFKQADKSVSMTDCVVMATADKYKTRQIFGFDQDFRDNGYLAPIPLHKP